MQKLTIYYNVQDCGDGSAYPRFFSHKKLAKLHEEWNFEDTGEGWGESCTGSVTVQSESLITYDTNQITTPDSWIKDMEEEIYEENSDWQREENDKLRRRIAVLKELYGEE